MPKPQSKSLMLGGGKFWQFLKISQNANQSGAIHIRFIATISALKHTTTANST